MKSSVTVFVYSSLAAGLLLINACSTAPQHTFASDVSPAAIERDLSGQLAELNRNQYNVLAPTHYDMAAKALERARKEINSKDENVVVLNSLQVAKDEIGRANTQGSLWKTNLDSAVLARGKALTAGAPMIYPKELAKVDKDFEDITRDDFQAPRNGEAEAQLQRRYMDLELKTIQEVHLGSARSLIKSAKEQGAAKFAKKTLEKAETDLLDAERAIEANRNNPDLSQSQADRAGASARELLSITQIAKESRGKSPEEVALAIHLREKEIAKREAETAAAEKSAQASRAKSSELSQEVTNKNQVISGQTETIVATGAALDASNAKIKADQDRAAKLKEIEQRFSKEEAEVYTQEGNIVLRLKAIDFPTARSDLPNHSLATLAKVGAVLDDLKAKEVLVEGHTDSIGTQTTNQRLSEARATSVSNYLESLQKNNELSNRAKITAVGRGFEKPLASNKSKAGRAENRRVDIVITPSPDLQ